ncbi:MAG: mechanosensitive ion channel [Chloroflexi bacterium]|nr:mechanosensitive ion channel [Chloroflexota bacterium]
MEGLALDLGPLVGWLVAGAVKQVQVVIRIAVIVALAGGSYQLLSHLVEQRIAAYRPRGRTVKQARLENKAATTARIARDTIKYVILAFALYLILREFSLDLTPVLASIGIVGIALSFGAQSMVRDIITGLNLFIEDQINVGDFVEIVGVAGAAGVVEDFGLRATRIRDIHGDLHYVPNGQIGAINRYPRGFVVYHVDVAVPAASDRSALARALLDAAEQLAAQVPLTVGPPRLVEAALDTPYVRLEVRVLPLASWLVERELVARLKATGGSLLPGLALADPVVYRVSPELLLYRQRVVDSTEATEPVAERPGLN